MNKKEKFVIQGLAGEKRLNGKVKINGAKNSALKAMAGSILFAGEVVLNNIPNTEDIQTMSEILIDLGAKVAWQDDDPKTRVLKINTKGVNKTDIRADFAKTMRASVVLTGPLLARFGKVSFPAPGGCVIGARPIDLFIEGYKKMGAKVTLRDDLYHIEVSLGLVGSEIEFKKISVGGTETLMMAAVLSGGTIKLKNCAIEPEIGNVALWLNANGAKIRGIDTATLIIEGNDGKLLDSKIPYTAIPDRIETGSFLVLGALCAERLEIENCKPDHIGKVIEMLKESGVNISIQEGKGENKTIVVVNDEDKPDFRFKAFNVDTREYPGFPTDLQSPIVSFLSQALGESSVVENIFEGRFKYVEDLNKMGADVTLIEQNKVLIKGPTPLHHLSREAGQIENQELSAHDIRAGFAIVIAALIAKGESVINNVHLIDRGYESLEVRLRAIGADVVRKQDLQIDRL